MTHRPNHGNKQDACCACGDLHPTPRDHEKPGEGELAVWQPGALDPPQWICQPCKKRLEADARRDG